MADFTELISRIQQLEENIIMPITSAPGGADKGFNDLDGGNFNIFDMSQFQTSYDFATTTTFNAPSIQTTSDLSVYLSSLAPKENEPLTTQSRLPFPITPGVPVPFFKEMMANPAPPLPSFQSLARIEVAPNSQPGLAQVLASAEPGATIVLSPGVYEGNFIIRQDIQLKSDGNAYFDSNVSSLYIESGNVSLDRVNFRHGNVILSGISKAQFTDCLFNAPLIVRGDAIVSCHKSSYKCPDHYGVEVEENGNLTLIQCSIEDNGIHQKSGCFNILKSKIESVQESCAFIEGGTSFIEECSLGDCPNTVVNCINKSTVLLTNCSIYDSEKGNLVSASRGAIVKIKGGSLSGHCNASVISSNGGSLSAEDIELGKPVITNNNALLRLKRCKPVIVFVDNSHLILSESQIIASPKSGLISVGFSDLQVESTIFSSCTANGIELSENTTATIINSQFVQNQVAGALIFSISTCFRDCVFDGNNFIGCQISGNNASPSFENCLFINNAVSGATMLEFTSPTFNGCQFKQNEKFGCIASKSTPSFMNSEFSINQGIGFDVKNGSVVQLHNCVFDSNNNFAAQVGGQGTSCQFIQCSFSKHSLSSSTLIYGKAIALFDQCLFSLSGCCHAEIRDDAKGRFEQCVLSEASGGIGIYCHTRGQLEVEKSSLKDESKTAIFVGNRGQALILDSDISNCHLCGIITELQSTSIIMRNSIRQNGLAGIQAEGGELKIDSNVIESHSEFGIYSTNVAQVIQENNTFLNNGKADTQIA